MDEILEITLLVAGTFDRLGVEYVIGGSLASSLHGIPRATLDVDIVARLRTNDIAPFVQALGTFFYLDEDAIRTAVEEHGSFNVISLNSFFKADIFIAKDDAATQLELERGQRITLGNPPRELRVATAEDVIAQKLFWFSLGDEVSERQWGDAIGVLKVSGPTIDLAYLRRVSRLLGVEGLVERALQTVSA